ncbi:MAG: CoA-disulfide reductase, partial [Cryobacterium sp.]|nr:CoA-disulfide reductase [Cryobacterium sp.]
MKTIIIGGVAGGMSAATRLRRLDEAAEIVVFERGPYVSFANCGLPYYVGGIIEDRGSLLLQTPESLAARFRLDVRVNEEVIRIDRTAKTVQVSHVLDGTTTTESYDVLILAAGAKTGPVLPGSGVPVRTLRTVDDVDAITSVLEELGAGARAVVVGAGFIGLEAVENLVTRGVNVTLVQRGSRPLSPLDPEMASPVLKTLLDHGVDVRVNSTVTDVRAGQVHLDDGSVIKTDLIIEARGVRPDTHLARSAGLTVGV